MQIRRIRRLSVKDEWPMCDFCDEPFTAGFEFGGENVGGPRGSGLAVCDKCLERTKKSSIGFLLESTIKT